MKLLLLLSLSISAFAAEYIVKLKPGAKADFLSSARSMTKETFKTSYAEFAVIETNSRSAIAALARSPWVEYYEENQEWYIDPIYDPNENYAAGAYTPDDQLYGDQWALKNTGDNSGSFWSKGTPGMDINAEEAWTVLTGHPGIKIAVIDTVLITLTTILRKTCG